MTATHSVPAHPVWLRVAHWCNALAFLVLMASGWRIYNATAFLHFRIPAYLTLGDWLGGALLWHFAAMWLLVANGLVYLFTNVLSGRLLRRFFPLSPRGLLQDIGAALRGHLMHDDPGQYNQVQKLAYLFAMLDGIALVLSGLVLWKSVQFGLLRTLLGGYEGARLIHFVAMSGGLAFLLIHVAMTLLFPRTLLGMTRGH